MSRAGEHLEIEKDILDNSSSIMEAKDTKLNQHQKWEAAYVEQILKKTYDDSSQVINFLTIYAQRIALKS